MSKRTRRRLFWLIPCVLLLMLLTDMLLSSYALKTTRYTIQLPQLTGEVRLVYLSDLHGREFGKDNRQLVESIAAEKPELIALTGDILPVDAQPEDIERYGNLLRELRKIAPVYLSPGNTELAQESTNWRQIAFEAGAVLLDEQWQDIEINGNQVRIGGVYEYAFPHGGYDENWESSSTCSFLREFTATKLPTVLLCHRPDSFIFYDAYKSWSVDLLLCGHTHGGIIRVPFKGGLRATDQGWFPEYDYGQYQLDEIQMIITSGFAGHEMIPRLHNRPEIVTVTLTP